MDREEFFSRRSKTPLIVVGTLVVALGVWFLLSEARVDRYGGMPDLLIGQWVEVLDSNIVRMRVSRDRVTLISRAGKSQTCHIDRVLVSNNLFGAGGDIRVSCEPLLISNAPLWRCYESALSVEPHKSWLTFKSDDVSFGEVNLYSQNFLHCSQREFVGLWHRR